MQVGQSWSVSPRLGDLVSMTTCFSLCLLFFELHSCALVVPCAHWQVNSVTAEGEVTRVKLAQA
jgi:hypothetical protein